MSAASDFIEIPFLFNCHTQQLIGILSEPAQASSHNRIGVLVVVGGPQYRVGSHRQFVLLCRALAKEGIATFRFDFRGMGDGDGDIRSFESVDDDIACAMDAFFKARPSMEKVVLWGLCDGASAACFYAPKDPRVAGMVILNPWVRTEEGEAKVLLKNYYWERFTSGDFWQKIFSGRFNVRESFSSLCSIVGRVVGKKAEKSDGLSTQNLPLPQRVLGGIQNASCSTLTLLSGKDFVAAEFESVVAKAPLWEQLLASGRTSVKRFEQANHTFSSQVWRGEVEAVTIKWVKELV